MALFQCNFFSQTPLTGTNLYVIIPTPDSDELLNHKKTEYFKPGKMYQTLYLLHGGYGDYSDWVRFTSIEKYAQERKLAVVMASAGNSFYQNMSHGGRYFDFISNEIPHFVQSMFPLSKNREDNFVAGLSMGGYGAFKLGLSKPDTFCCAASLSGAVDVFATLEMGKNMPSDMNFQDICDDPEKIKGTESDLLYTLEQLKISGAEIPQLYQGCGTEDFTLEINRSVRDRIRALGVALTYEESPGGHTWDYWDTNIQKVLDWLPLKRDLV